MSVDSVIVPGGISSTDGYLFAARKILEEPSFTDFLFKNWYYRNLKLCMMYNITQLWPLSLTFIPGFRELVLPKKPPIPAVHI